MVIVLITIVNCKLHALIHGMPLSTEIGLVLSLGFLWGAELSHLAAARIVAPASVTFLTLGER